MQAVLTKGGAPVVKELWSQLHQEERRLWPIFYLSRTSINSDLEGILLWVIRDNPVLPIDGLVIQKIEILGVEHHVRDKPWFYVVLSFKQWVTNLSCLCAIHLPVTRYIEMGVKLQILPGKRLAI